MITIERLRPEEAHLDPEWSASTLTAILASEGGPERKRRVGGPTTWRPRRLDGAVVASLPVRWFVAGLALAGAAATAVAIGAGTTGPATDSSDIPSAMPEITPAAFTVASQADGDVVVTIRKIDQADELAQALRDKGVEAEVTYDGDWVPPEDLAELLEDAHHTKHVVTEGGPECPPIRVDRATGGFVFTLPAVAVESDAKLLLTTAAGDLPLIRARWQGTC